MKRVIIESPYAGKFSFSKGPRWFQGVMEKIINFFIRRKHVKYARECMKDSLNRNEAPYLSHLLYTQVLDDNQPDERYAGIYAGFAWGECADLVAVYCDRGISPGMKKGIEKAEERGAKIEYRRIK